MKTPTRIYLVAETSGSSLHLVEASNQAQALRHVVRGRYTVEAALALEVARLMSEGVRVEKASAEEVA